MSIDESIRRQLVVLARRSRARSDEFSPNRPTDWRPQEVRNPAGTLDLYFTKTTAWEFIASHLESGHPVEVITLRQPPGATGYVMEIDVEDGQPPIYIKLQLGSGRIIGRSFHYSRPED